MVDERADIAWAMETIDALAAIDDDDARAALVACLDAEPAVAAAASRALTAGGPPSVPICRAALADPSRAPWAALALGDIGTGEAIDALRGAATRAVVETRAAIAVALYRAGDRDHARWTTWLAVEPDDGVAALIADVLGRAPRGSLAADAVAALLARASSSSPSWLRAIAGWAAAAHDRDAGVAVALELLDDPVLGAMLATCVVHRGGPLLPLVDGVETDVRLDLTAALLPAIVAGGGGG